MRAAVVPNRDPCAQSDALFISARSSIEIIVSTSCVVGVAFMGSSSGTARACAKENDRPNGSATDQMVECVLTDIAKSLWRKNTAASLAAELGCSVRTVERYMEGSREWSGEAIAAIVQEILVRHRMRNVRVTSR